jgi:hypothetical protein
MVRIRAPGSFGAFYVALLELFELDDISNQAPATPVLSPNAVEILEARM